MILFWRLVFGHLLADFTFQSNFVNRWKRMSVWGMLVHCGMHPLTYIVLTWPFLNDSWISVGTVRLSGWMCVLILFVLHFIEDEYRIFSIFRFKSPDNTLFFIWDQFIHYAAIFVLFPIGLSDMSHGWFPEKWPVLGSLVVAVTHFCTVLVYFIEKDLWDRPFPEFDEKYLSMLMRVILALCFLLPGLWCAMVALLWVVNLGFMKYRRILDFSWFSLGAGGVVSVLCGLAARFVYYS